jgi:putative MFS transporter
MSIGDGHGHLGGAVQPYIVVAALGALGPRATFWVIAGMLAVGGLTILLGGMRTAGASLTEMAR